MENIPVTTYRGFSAVSGETTFTQDMADIRNGKHAKLIIKIASLVAQGKVEEANHVKKHRFLLPSYFIYVIIGILSGALRGTGKVLVPMLLTCGGVCSLRILWLFTAGQMYPGINTIMLSYPVSWSITAVLFIVYYFMKFPGKKKEN